MVSLSKRLNYVACSLAFAVEHERWMPLVEPKSFHGFMARHGRESSCNLSLSPSFSLSHTHMQRRTKNCLRSPQIKEENLWKTKRGNACTSMSAICKHSNVELLDQINKAPKSVFISNCSHHYSLRGKPHLCFSFLDSSFGFLKLSKKTDCIC